MTQSVLVVQHHDAVFPDAVDALTHDGLTVAALNTVCLSNFLIRWSGSTFDGLLLDAALNCGRAAELCAKLRSNGFSGAILIFGSAADEDSVVTLLEAGADDVCPLTLQAAELVARVRTNLRERSARQPSLLAAVARAA